MRFAIAYNIESEKRLTAYLPDNYEVIPNTITTTPDYKVRIGIKGEDVAGWTLDDYVIPRLASGNIQCREVSSQDAAYDGTVGVMN